MNKSVDLARIRSTLKGKKLLGYRQGPMDGMLLSRDKLSKAGPPESGGVRVGAVKVGVRKVGILKVGVIKQGHVKKDSAKL
jgi:hypothetical protein